MDCSEEDWEFGMRLNAFSPFICIKYALPHMLKSVRTTATRLAAVGPGCCRPWLLPACVFDRRLLLRLRVLASTTDASMHELIHNQASCVRSGWRLNHHHLLRPRLPPPSWPAKRPLPDVQGRAREPDIQHRGGELTHGLASLCSCRVAHASLRAHDRSRAPSLAQGRSFARVCSRWDALARCPYVFSRWVPLVTPVGVVLHRSLQSRGYA